MEKLFIVLGLVTSIANAEVDPSWQDYSAQYPASNHKISKVTVEHKIVKDVNLACNAERKQVGKEPFKFSVDACSVWHYKITGNTCVIITGPMTSQGQLGHEFRHCLQGNFH